MKRSMIFALALAVGAPAALHAQDAGIAYERIAEAFARAEAAGVPMDLLQLRLAEGEAKGVPLDILADAMTRRADALIAAGEAMPSSDAQTVAAGAHALESGIGADVLGYIETTVPTERRYVAVYVLSHLVNLGHAPAEAQQTVEQALARGPDALANIATQAEEAPARRGLSGAFGAASIPAFAGPPAGLPAPGSIPTGPPNGIPFGGPSGDGA